ncbi:MAG TPA: hypothetical protein VHB27_04430 [Rhodopila sp.]|uniref:hypothetical protein n=1 Tax=Rhodopila sp. TaxID=2480087 RepID=UPI002CA025D9|nr:hypothetical protein [Rhodopila sp.]HVY14450.1 hypothetical protein [Rhodopila sp.]
MILTADSTVAHANNRRKTANGWHTTFIGQNRNTLKEGDAVPSGEGLYPMAFLVEKEAGAIVKPHFHQADQYQVIVEGSGRLGIHDVASVAIHYTDAYSAYGPIVAADEGVAWFTLRNTWDPGARYMPAARQQLREARAKHQHREATCGPLPPLSSEDLAALTETNGVAVIAETTDGLGSWRYAVPALGSVTGPDPAVGGGQFWLVAAGSVSVAGSALLPSQSCIFVAPDDTGPRIIAGPGGADLICMQFPAHAANDRQNSKTLS